MSPSNVRNVNRDNRGSAVLYTRWCFRFVKIFKLDKIHKTSGFNVAMKFESAEVRFEKLFDIS